MVAGILPACTGVQSALTPAGTSAERIATLFWVMTFGGAIIWLAVLGLMFYAAYIAPERHSSRTRKWLVIGGGVVFPVVTLTALLVYGLALLRPLLEPAPPGSPRIVVTGEQYWWRVRYEMPGRSPIELANEVHLPLGEKSQLILEARDVIHSFWAPSLAGKVDMIPGRTNRHAIEPTKPGIYRGACAEYCGTSHALMAFIVVVEDRKSFERWLDEQSAPAKAPPAAPFLASGCGACHTVRGTPADGTIGPDLTHVGSRHTIAAGIFPADEDNFARWIRTSTKLKPGVHMPAFGMLPDDELRAIARYLEALQ